MEKFFFNLENVVSGGKEISKRSFELFAHLDGAALEFYLGHFTVEASINSSRKNYGELKKAFLERFAKQMEP